MTCRPLALAVLACAISAGGAFAQSHNLRGLTDSTPNRLPSARQQLDQSLQRGKRDLSTRQQRNAIDSLNRTDSINRLNTRPDPPDTKVPCPSANEACRQ
ncbi:MAG: hypothetical protein Tsb0019_33710 [Roseibium sp.]